MNIYLPSGDITEVSPEDFEFLNQFTWFRIGGRSNLYYVARWLVGRKFEYMHKVVLDRMNVVVPDGHEPDHVDRDGFNNQRDNLRVLTKSENNHNTRIRKDNVTGIRGVSFYAKYGKYRARISKNGSAHFLGYFNTVIEAETAILKAR